MLMIKSVWFSLKYKCTVKLKIQLDVFGLINLLWCLSVKTVGSLLFG